MALIFRLGYLVLLLGAPLCFAGMIALWLRKRCDGAVVLFCGAIGLVPILGLVFLPLSGAIRVIPLLASLVAGPVCAVCGLTLLCANTPRWRIVFSSIGAVVGGLLALWALPRPWCFAFRGALFWALVITSLLTIPVCFACGLTFLCTKRYCWGMVFSLTSAAVCFVVIPVLLNRSTVTALSPYWTILYRDCIDGDHDFIWVLPESIPYSVARIRAGDRRAMTRYAGMLKEMLEYPQRLGEREREALAQAIKDLRRSCYDGRPAVRAAAAEALGRMHHELSALFTEPEGAAPARGKKRALADIESGRVRMLYYGPPRPRQGKQFDALTELPVITITNSPDSVGFISPVQPGSGYPHLAKPLQEEIDAYNATMRGWARPG